MRKLQVMPSAIEALKYWKQTDHKKYKKIKKMLEQICATPKNGIGKPEQLKHKLTGLWSRRIDKANRLVYNFDDEYAYLWQARYHYSEIPEQSSIDESVEIDLGNNGFSDNGKSKS
jgi:toxin YoeB